MTEKEIEDFIVQLDKDSQDMCVYPNKQTGECCDCYLCRVDFFNNVRKELKNES